jgi:prepilin-type N-terminal cleavage/methylation domain-containing protein
MKRTHNGFTLIELLIVVAIIAILAAIAIVNYLNAQTRAKVSRAKSEIQTVVTGLEAYNVDYNAYPPYHYVDLIDFFLGGWANAVGVSEPFDGANPITTPIAYLSIMPDDPFYKPSANDPYEKQNYNYVNWNQAYAIAPIQTFETALIGFGPYRVHSIGPEQVGPTSGIPYDPSNGTISAGNIYYSPNTGFDTPVVFTTSFPN